jgi:tankyrase
LHEAAQKGRTQLCALLLAHGADPYMKNQEGQTSLELASADDVKCLLQDAMVSSQPQLSSANSSLLATACSPTTETVTLPTGASMTLSVPVPQVIQ